MMNNFTIHKFKKGLKFRRNNFNEIFRFSAYKKLQRLCILFHRLINFLKKDQG